MITTNKTFTEWREIFPSAACLVSLIDRLTHDSDISSIEADSYRLYESMLLTAKRKEARAAARAKAKAVKLANTNLSSSD